MRRVTLLITWLGLLAVLVSGVSAQSITFAHDFEDGAIPPGDRTQMAVKPFVAVEPNGNHYLVITGSLNDCESIPNTDCPGLRMRATIMWTPSPSAMPLLTSAEGQQSWTYEHRARWTSNSPYDFSAGELFMSGTQTGGYGTQDGNGPVARVPFRTDSTINMTSLYDNETESDSFARTVADGNWHHYKTVATWSHDPSKGRVQFFFDGQQIADITGRATTLGPGSKRIPGFKHGIYGNGAGAIAHFDDIKAYPTSQGPPGGGGGPTQPPAAQTLIVATTGTGTACTTASPCSYATAKSRHNGGDTIRLGNGSYTDCCDNCWKSGTSTRPTVIESLNRAGTPLLVGTQGISINPGLATLTCSGTTPTILLRGGTQWVTVRDLTVVGTGAGTAPIIAINDTPDTTAASNILLENLDVTGPNRTGGNAISLRAASRDVTIRTTRVHDAAQGIGLNGTNPRIEDSDVFSNDLIGIAAFSAPTNATVLRTRIFGNTQAGLDTVSSLDSTFAYLEIFDNGREGVVVGAGTRRTDLYNLTVDRNSRESGSDYVGVRIEPGATYIAKNNISTGHPTEQYQVPSPATGVCAHNLSSAATEPLAGGCTSMSLGAVRSDTFADPDHSTLSLRNYDLIGGSDAIDNGTNDICSATDAGANLCGPPLTLAGLPGGTADQGAHEFTAPVSNIQVVDLRLDNAFVNDAPQGDDATGINVTFDATNTLEGSHAALFDATTDRIQLPTTHWDITRGITLAVGARTGTTGSVQYVVGHSSSSSSYANRLQMFLTDQDRYAIGLGDTHDLLTTSYSPAANGWEVYYLVVGPALNGAGTFKAFTCAGQVGRGVYQGLTAFGPYTYLGNNGVNQAQAWGAGSAAQLDAVAAWNYPLSDAEVAADAAVRCAPTTPGGDPLEFGLMRIGALADHQVDIAIVAGAISTLCDTLADWQVTYDGVAQTETACTVSGTGPQAQVVLTLATPAQAGQVVQLTHADFPGDVFDVLNVVSQPCGTLVFANCQVHTNGLTVLCQLAHQLCAGICPHLTDLLMRDDCLPINLTGCAYDHASATLQLTRQQVPPTGSTPLDLLYFPTDQRVSVANGFVPGGSGEPSTTGMHQLFYRFRSVVENDLGAFDGLPNTPGRVPSPGSVEVRMAIGNESGSLKSAFRTSIKVSRRDVGGNFSDFVPVTVDWNSLGVRYAPIRLDQLADDAPLLPALQPYGGSLTAHPRHRMRRTPQDVGSRDLADDEVFEEGHALEVIGALPFDTAFVVRMFDVSGQPLESASGVAGCSNDPDTFGAGVVPCGALWTIDHPRLK